MKPQKKPKENRGGARENAGRKKADYQTKVVSFRIRTDLVDDVVNLVKDYISNHTK